MSSESHASYAKIGFAVVFGAAAILATLIYLGGMRGRGEELLLETYYDKPVSGLSVGSPVNFRGVKVGEVREITFVGAKYDVSPEDFGRIYVLMSILRKHVRFGEGQTMESLRDGVKDLISRGLCATVTASGITGISRVEFDFRNAESPSASRPILWKPAHVYIPPQISVLDNFSDSATKVMAQINKMNLNAAWSNIHATVESLASMSVTAQRFFEARQPELERILQNLESATSAANEFAERLRENPSVLLRGTEPPARLDETTP